MSDHPTLLLICGLPGAGKTTLARELAARRGAVRLSPDEWLSDLELSLFDEPLRDRLEKRLIGLTEELLRHGQSVILEFGFWSRTERETLRDRAHTLGARAELWVLELPQDELWERIERRNNSPEWHAEPITREHLKLWWTLFERPTDQERRLFDEADGIMTL
ncbi:AAA family ATPase [Microlunatus speluncae]|uniref:AAA family ATPase n=1 Tax=Microlunatus speluncae TaxID=2594267 RepID=UPI0012661E19|nr:AAA family ATPase [Microlunatus speluncae]